MKKKVLVTLLSLILVSIAGCNDDKNETKLVNTNNTESQQTNNQKSLEEGVNLLAQKTAKGNLWLSTMNENFGPVLRAKTGVLSDSIEGDLLENTKNVLEKLSSSKTGKFDVKKLTKNGDSFHDMKIDANLTHASNVFTMRVSEGNLKRATNAFEYMKTLTPAIPELDTVGNAYGEAYVDLYAKLLKLGDYLFTKKTYRLDDYAQANGMYDDINAAYIKLVEEREKMAAAYNNYYQVMHVEEKQLIKQNGQVVRYNIMESLDTVEEMFTVIASDKIDIQKLEEASSKIDIQLANIESIFKDEKMMQNEGMKVSSYHVASYLKNYEQLAIEIKVLIKDIKAGKKVEDNLDKISRQYKSLVDNYNSIVS